ncbi:MAG: glycosyl hydrolase family 65 protein [Syntrophobacterales bacterium]|jgi:alpha,alpha-trehalose phosphorylase
MLKRQPLNPPQHIYPVDPWRIVEKQFYPRMLAQTESIFSISNGYLGQRGCFEEGTPAFENCTLINGFYEIWPLSYGEKAHGFAKEGQTIVNVTDGKIIKLFVDDELFSLNDANLVKFERILDFRGGTLDREIVWEMPSGKRISIKSTRLVSYKHRHVAAISYEVRVLNAQAQVVISSEMRHEPSHPSRDDDPRFQQHLSGRVLNSQVKFCKDKRVVLGHLTERSNMALVCGIDHNLETDCPYSFEGECSEDEGKVVFSFDAPPEMPIKLVKFMAYHTSDNPSFEELVSEAERTLDAKLSRGFEDLLAGQREYLDDFWSRSDVQIEGDPRQEHRCGELQQALRFNLFQIFQAAVRVGDKGIPAKGLTGQAYDGNYFWDTEVYVLPFLTYTHPQIAKNLLNFRYRMLDKARERASEVNEQGALFPWRTINGEEASAYYATGTAQYHINADIMYAVMKYVEITGDEEFLWQKGAEMLVETARMWCGLGFFSERQGGLFCLHGVTGPDEYTTVVDNNLYTNLMAQNNLHFATNTIKSLKKKEPDLFAALVNTTNLDPAEIDLWQRAADQMNIPFDKEFEIHPQDDTFLQKKVWDFKHTPVESYPLLLHFHPLKIYRYQVVKQADVVLAMLLLGDKFSREQKRRNFDYYDPLTTGDSSLSVCIQSIVAAELGYLDKALEYFHYAVLMDLEDVGGNVKDGCHMASMGGSWMLCVYGLGGMRDQGGHLSFNPRLPPELKRLHFPLTIRGQMLEVTITQDSVTFLLREGSKLAVRCQDQEINLTRGTPVSVEYHFDPAGK